MGIWDVFSDLVEAATPWSTVEAEAVSGGKGTEPTPAEPDEEGEGEAKDPSGPTPDKKDMEAGKEKAEGKDASGNDPDNKYGPAGDKDKGNDDGDDEEPEEEEEDEEEIVDPKEKFEEECRESKGCAPAKHHFDECVERVTGAAGVTHDKKHPGEDCVEEFFHLAHCANQCAAPKLWSALK